MQKKKYHFQRKAALISLDKLQDIVYLSVSMGLVIEKRWEYGHDKAIVYAHFDEKYMAGYTEKRSDPAQGDLRPIHTLHAVPMPFPCHAVPLMHTSRAAPLPCFDSAVSFVEVRVVAGNIRIATPTG
jgi:hypothetical protein